MTNFFYSLPIWLSSALVLVTSLVIGLGSSLGIRALFRIKATAEEREVAINLMQVVAAYVGIMIAFSGVQVWQDFADAKGAVSHEAATAAQLYQDLSAYGPDAATARLDLRVYVTSIVDDEWPRLWYGEGSPATESALINLFDEIGQLRPQDDRDAVIYEEAFGKLNDLVDARRERIVQSQEGIPLILWTIGLVGGLLTVSYSSAFSPTRYNIMMITGISIALGLVFLFILTVDYPFKGEFSVSNREIVELIPEFDKFDQLALTHRIIP